MHDLEHTWSRRDVLRLAGICGLGGLTAGFPKNILSAESPRIFSSRSVQWNRRLVLIELDGGNDGLNTLIPVDDDLYYNARAPQGVSIGKNLALSLTGVVGQRLHPRLQHTRNMFHEGDLAIVQGVGYNDSNRSHFRGIDIWNTGSDADSFLDTGWLARIYAGTEVPSSIAAEGTIHQRTGSNPIEGSGRDLLAMSSAERFVKEASGLLAVEESEWASAAGSPELEHLLNIHERIRSTADIFREQLTDGDPNNYTPPSYTIPFPDSRLGKQLRSICDIITSGLAVPVHKASFSGFDTHASQVNSNDPTTGTHADLLREYDDAMYAFRSALQQHNQWNNTLVMTYSEFGRRLMANASRGTDHGAASCHFLTGGAITGGLYGTTLDLHQDSLIRGDPVATTDFRRLYTTAATFMGMDSQLAFPDNNFSPLDIL